MYGLPQLPAVERGGDQSACLHNGSFGKTPGLPLASPFSRKFQLRRATRWLILSVEASSHCRKTTAHHSLEVLRSRTCVTEGNSTVSYECIGKGRRQRLLMETTLGREGQTQQVFGELSPGVEIERKVVCTHHCYESK